jgi:hypothetical protein
MSSGQGQHFSGQINPQDVISGRATGACAYNVILAEERVAAAFGSQSIPPLAAEGRAVALRLPKRKLAANI